MNFEWKQLPRGDVAPHWSGLYVTMNPRGHVHLSKQTWLRLGEPEAFHIFWNEVLKRLLLRPARRRQKHAYPVAVSGKYGGKVVRAYRLMTEFNIQPNDTIEFITPRIDDEGALILDLGKYRLSPKAHSQCRGRQAEWKW